VSKDYWAKFWVDYGKDIEGKDPQTQVLRTFNKQPIEPEKWEFTLKFIEDTLEINESDDALDLCCGNGLISHRFAETCKSVTSVDVSEELVSQIDTKKYPNINAFTKDIRELDFEANSFSKIIIYAGVQYLDNKETIIFFESVYKWLEDDGLFFLGDIPDIDKRWTFFNNKEREKVFFDNIKEEKQIVGTWFSQNFLTKLADYCGFSESRIILQHEDMIYSSFRYDMLIRN